jgi:type II secretory pathway pseudopilin PulG
MLSSNARASPIGNGTSRRGGFSIVEAIVALSITAMAGAVLLLAVESTVQSTTDSVQRTVADGLAQQLLDEALTKRFVSPGNDPLSNSLGANAFELAGAGRERYNDSDDLHQFSATPAEGLYGEQIGTGDDAGGFRHASFRVPGSYFQNWRQRVEVYFVDPSDHRIKLTGSTSYFRAIEVHIEIQDGDGTWRTLATRKRIVAYVPPP